MKVQWTVCVLGTDCPYNCWLICLLLKHGNYESTAQSWMIHVVWHLVTSCKVFNMLQDCVTLQCYLTNISNLKLNYHVQTGRKAPHTVDFAMWIEMFCQHLQKIWNLLNNKCEGVWKFSEATALCLWITSTFNIFLTY